MSQQLTDAIDTAGPEDNRSFWIWLDGCAQGMATRPELMPQGALMGGIVVALRQPGAGLHPILVAATVTAREADPAAYGVVTGMLRAVVRPAWAPLAAEALHELSLADADGRRQVADAARAAEALDGVPPELGGDAA